PLTDYSLSIIFYLYISLSILFTFLFLLICFFFLLFFFFNDTATTEIYTLSLHDALPICYDAMRLPGSRVFPNKAAAFDAVRYNRSEEHTSELQSRFDLVCRLLLEKKKKKQKSNIITKEN